MSVTEIDSALAFLQKHGCTRDPQRGMWITATGLALACGPLESAQLLRRAMAAEHYRAAQSEGRMLTR